MAYCYLFVNPSFYAVQDALQNSGDYAKESQRTVRLIMENIKIISIFKINEKVPFMTCIATDMEESEGGIKLMLESGESICIKDYSYYLLSLMP